MLVWPPGIFTVPLLEEDEYFRKKRLLHQKQFSGLDAFVIHCITLVWIQI